MSERKLITGLVLFVIVVLLLLLTPPVVISIKQGWELMFDVLLERNGQ